MLAPLRRCEHVDLVDRVLALSENGAVVLTASGGAIHAFSAACGECLGSVDTGVLDARAMRDATLDYTGHQLVLLSSSAGDHAGFALPQRHPNALQLFFGQSEWFMRQTPPRMEFAKQSRVVVINPEVGSM
jgi:hypothetical protein